MFLSFFLVPIFPSENLKHYHLPTFIHAKPTNLQEYLNFSSCHSSSTTQFPTHWLSEGGASAVTWMTSTPTPLTSPNPSSPVVTPHPLLPSKFLKPSQPTHDPDSRLLFLQFLPDSFYKCESGRCRSLPFSLKYFVSFYLSRFSFYTVLIPEYWCTSGISVRNIFYLILMNDTGSKACEQAYSIIYTDDTTF